MKLYKIILSAITFTIISLASFAQQQDSTIINNIIAKTKKLSDEQPIEKIYLHFDKPYYAVADTIWFKAYATIEQNLPSPLSKIVYVEVFTAKDSLVQTLKLPLKNSVAYGNIPLNMDSYKQGNYYIRAYTLWMANFDSAYFFSKNMVIGEAIDKQLNTFISFTNEKIDKNIKTTAKIQFKDINKKAYANKVVNWKIIANYDEFLKGKGTTDQNGVLNVSVTSKNGEPITNGAILTELNIAEKEIVNASFDLKQNINQIDVQFFPEGGELISGIPNQVAFKALKSNGLGISLKGSIIDQNNTEISSFVTSNAGMGSFYLTPEAGKTYKAKVTFADNSSALLTLPTPNDSGISLQVANSNAEFINIKLIANSKYFEANKGKTYYITALNTNSIYYAAKAALQNQVIMIKIPKKDLPSGVTQLTLFNELSEAIGERLVFVLNTNPVALNLKSDLTTYKPRQKVALTLTAKEGEKPVVGDYSISVIDEQKVPIDENNETTIYSSLLLTSDLKGYIEKPNYYFTNINDKKLADLDKLMLTQGYRRFAFKDILAGNYPRISLLPEQGIVLRGTLRDATGMPYRKGALRLMVTGKPISAETTTTNLGLFSFQNLNFPDSSQVVISAKYNPNPNLVIVMDGLPSAAPGKNINLADEVVNIDTTLNSYLNNSQKQYRFLRTLKEVEVKTRSNIKRPSHQDHSSLAGLGAIADHQIEPTQLTACSMLLECLKTAATGLIYVSQDEKFYVSRDYNSGSRVPVQVFLNGMPIETRDINTVNIADLESVQIFLKDLLGSVDRLYGTKGVLVINTKKAPVGKKISKQELLDMLPKTNIVTLNPMGYSKERAFYHPKYLPNAMPTNTDLRTTIYWNPKAITDEKGIFNAEFFNADGRGTYRVVVEGFDQNGNIGRAVYKYTVK